jgi:septal ring factor EnvC (AmiA/AmiB activator)
MADSAGSGEESKAAQKQALAISIVKFGGFQWKNGRLCLGWITFSTIPSNVEDQLSRAGEEIKSLQAEIARVSDESRQQLASAHDENQALQAQIARATTEAEAKLGLVRKENEALQAQISRLSFACERLQALVERVSSGLR